MKEIKILHLFPTLMCLYGEYGNVALLRKTLGDAGYSVTVEEYETGELVLSGYDLVYIGCSTEDNLMVALDRLMPYQEAISEAVEKEQHWLVTGNAMALFGRKLDGQDALNVFDYETVISSKRYLGDVLSQEGFVGFVNTGCQIQGIGSSWLTLQLNPQLGNDKANPQEGIHEKNFYATQLIGPLLTKNPKFLQQLCVELTGEEIVLPADSNICKAYEISYNELRKRLGTK